MKKLSLLSIALISVLLIVPGCSESKEKGNLPTAKNDLPVKTSDGQGLHDGFNSLLIKHVKDGRVNYKGFADDHQEFQTYLDLLATTDPEKLTKNQQLTYWVNAYNAFTIQLILDNKTIIKEGIKDISASKRWKRDDWKIGGGKTISLNDIEHEILRKNYNEPRIHFAIVCASYSCPNLRSSAFMTDTIDEQLNEQTKIFFKDQSKGFKLDKNENTLYLSQILKWFDDDFGANDNALIQRILPWLPEADQEYVKNNIDKLDINYFDYNWDLNGDL